MNITIETSEKDTSLILESVKAYFTQEFPDEEPEWRCSGTVFTTLLQTEDEEKIARIFRKLVKDYPELYVEASYSYDVREDDRSAQWWGVTKIYSKKVDGETKIVRSSSTYWN